MDQITVRTKGVYGNDLVYPVCDRARLLARLAGTKTLTREAMQTIRALGYRVIDLANVEAIVGQRDGWKQPSAN